MNNPSASVSPRETARTLRGGIVAVLAAQALLVVIPLHGLLGEPLLNALQALAGMLAVVVVVLRTALLPRQRMAWALFAVASAVDVVGTVGTSVADTRGVSGDGYALLGLAFYPLAYLVVLLLMRARLGSLGWGIALDGLLGGLGIAALAAAGLAGRLGANALDTVVSHRATMMGLVGAGLLLLIIVVSWAVAGWRLDRATTLIAVGVLTHLVAAAALVIRGDEVLAPGPITLCITLGYLAFASAPWQPDRPSAPDQRPAATVVLPALAFAASGGLLILGHFDELPLAAVILGGLAMLGAGARLAVSHRDIGRLAASQAEAQTDELTRLGNRRLLSERLGAAIHTRAGEEEVALLLTDLDRFKDVNDSLGHHVGDDLLRAVASRLRQGVGPTATVARLGGDEFAVVVGPAPDARLQAERLADDLLDRLRRPFRLHGAHVDVDASIGLAVCPHDASDAYELLRRADAAMYRAKASRTGTARFVAELDEATGRAALVQELARALSSRELEVHYQPIIHLVSGEVTRLEALVRWRHPTRGLLAPGDFLGLAERAALVPDILRYVLNDALTNVASWRNEGLSGWVSVNLSASEMCIPRLHSLVERELRSHNLPAEVLELEVSEDSLGIDLERNIAVLSQLRLVGVRLTIDDYGTGSNSTTYLRRLPVAAVKLDRAFVTALAIDPENQAIVNGISTVARALGIELVAEGVEAPAALPLLRGLGFHSAQGVAICPPLVASQATQWMRRRLARNTAESLR